RDMNYIVVINKTDLPQQIDLEQVKELTSDKRLVTTSLIEEEGIDQLEEAIAELFFEGEIEAGDMTYVSNVRHISLLHQAHQTVSDAISAAEMDVPVDMIQIDVTRT
ncbi:tRNA uridine-5-carboxymethylaminomethyl(34) synthesis GTPase MnmE, partial [Bacillus sp. SIMBA_161]